MAGSGGSTAKNAPVFDTWPAGGYGLDEKPEDDDHDYTDKEWYNGRDPDDDGGLKVYEPEAFSVVKSVPNAMASVTKLKGGSPIRREAIEPLAGMMPVSLDKRWWTQAGEDSDEDENGATDRPTGENKIFRITSGGLRKIIREEFSRVIRESETSELEEAEELSGMPEYSSVDAFAEYLIDDDRDVFTHVDLKALALSTKLSYAQIRTGLEAYGLSLAQRQPSKVVRGFTTSSNDRWFGPGSLKTHGGAGIDTSTGRSTVRGKTI